MLKKEPERTCVSCRMKKTKDNFIRIVKVNNQIAVNPNNKVNGRSMYVCKSEDCISKAIKTNAINRTFKMQVDLVVYEELRKVYENSKN